MDITLTTGQIANCWNDFEKITTTDLQQNSKDFYNIPVSVIVKRKSNSQPVDHLSIENIAMSKDGSEIWFECYVDDEQMIEKELKAKEHLNAAEEKYINLSSKLNEKLDKN